MDFDVTFSLFLSGKYLCELAALAAATAAAPRGRAGCMPDVPLSSQEIESAA